MKRFFILCFCLSTLTNLFAQEAYIYSYFKGNGEDGLHLAYSTDGYNWEALNNDKSFLTPLLSKDKLMRDPCIIKGGDGLYHMVWTISWTEKGIGYASSKDLINWSDQKEIPVMTKEEGVRNCWAPELTYDEKTQTYIIYWSSSIKGRYTLPSQQSEEGYNHRIYYVTTKDFKKFTETKLLYDAGFNAIDATIIPDGDKFVMFIKDEGLTPPQKNIRVAFSESLTGPYSQASAPITGSYWAEGPTVLRINDYWIVYFDKYKEGKFGAVMSNNFQNWLDVSDHITLPEGIRHGSILKVDKSLIDTIISAKK